MKLIRLKYILDVLKKDGFTEDALRDSIEQALGELNSQMRCKLVSFSWDDTPLKIYEEVSWFKENRGVCTILVDAEDVNIGGETVTNQVIQGAITSLNQANKCFEISGIDVEAK